VVLFDADGEPLRDRPPEGKGDIEGRLVCDYHEHKCKMRGEFTLSLGDLKPPTYAAFGPVPQHWTERRGKPDGS